MAKKRNLEVREQPAGMTITVREGGQFLIDPDRPGEAESAPEAEEGGTEDAHT